MIFTLVVSITLLTLTLGVRHYELSRGGSRLYELTRTRLDRTTIRAKGNVERIARLFFRYVHRDVFLYILHTIVYLALLFVRFVEGKLEKGIHFLRSFRKKEKTIRKATEKSKI